MIATSSPSASASTGPRTPGYRVEQAGGFLAEPELGPDLADRRRFELAFAPPGALTQTGEEPDRYAHGA